MRKRRLFPKVSYEYFPKRTGLWTKWFLLSKYWGGNLIYISVRNHTIILDYRMSWIDDMTSFGDKDG